MDRVRIVVMSGGGIRLALVAIVAWALVAGARPAGAQLSANALLPHPRLGLYGNATGSGFPFVRADQTIDAALLDTVARFGSVVLPASPFTEYFPQVLTGLRARHPGILLYGYMQADYAWPAEVADSLVHIPTLYYHLVRNLRGFLYDRQGNLFHDADINLAKRDVYGHYYMADSVADFLASRVFGSGKWDGLFLDRFCGGILWDQTPSESIDVVRAGYPTQAAFDTAWKAASDELAARLRKKVGSAAVLIGNCGQSAQYAWMNGWMHEDFPNQNGDSWDQNMFRTPGGYTVDEANFRAPESDWLSAWPTDVTQPYSTDALRRARFTLGSATLCDGFGVINPDSLDVNTNYLQWWYDEYAVDLATGRSSGSLANTGWLGPALAAYTSYPTLGPVDAAAPNNGFETDLSGWTFATSTGSTWYRDTVSPAAGLASAHVHVTNGGGLYPTTRVATSGTIGLFSSHAYRISFWMRAAAPRTVMVAAVDWFHGTDVFQFLVNPTTSWQHYDLDLTAPPTDVIVTLQFRCGGAAVDTWFDDVHFTQWGLALYRRDFQNGIVFVNPTFSAMSAALDTPCRRILGRLDPLTNDGSDLTTLTVPGDDAVFLLRASALTGVGPPGGPGGPPARLAFRGLAPNPLARGAVAMARLALPAPATIEVSVFDPAGRRVRDLGVRAGVAGENAIPWDGANDAGRRLPPGLYFLRAVAGGEVAARKVVLE